MMIWILFVVTSYDYPLAPVFIDNTETVEPEEIIDFFEKQATRKYEVIEIDQPDVLLEPPKLELPVIQTTVIQTQPWVPMGPAHCKRTRNPQAIRSIIIDFYG